MANEPVQLTPAQIAFLEKTIHGFSLKIGEWKITPAGHAGSDRQFFRVKSRKTHETFVLVVWDSSDLDWDRFLSIQRDLSPVMGFLPKLFAHDAGHGLILEEDLSNLTVKKYCLDPRNTKKGKEQVYRDVIDALAQWQSFDVSKSSAISAREMDKEMFLWESQYFADHCVKEYFGCDHVLTNAWEKERLELALCAASFPKVCIHRDFQSENIILCKSEVRFVDYQGARLGPAGYDLSSLLFDPYVPFLSSAVIDGLFNYYTSITGTEVTAPMFRICAIQRLMQALGAYGRLSIHKGKTWYKEYIPVALKRLLHVLEQEKEFSAITGVVCCCVKTIQ